MVAKMMPTLNYSKYKNTSADSDLLHGLIVENTCPINPLCALSLCTHELGAGTTALGTLSGPFDLAAAFDSCARMLSRCARF